MQLRYRFFGGGDFNPYESGELEAFNRLTKDRLSIDPQRLQPLEQSLEECDAWPDYVIAHSKAVFWKYERDISLEPTANGLEIEDFWKGAERNNKAFEFIWDMDAEEIEKAICYYMARDYARCNPGDKSVDFRLYFTEHGDIGAAHPVEIYE